MDAETGLEVGLIGRDGELRKRGVFHAQVVRTERNHNGQCYLTTSEQLEQGSTLVCELCMDNYWIVSVSLRPSDGWGDIEETYSETLEDLNEAFETIEVCRRYGEDETGFRVMESDDDGEEEESAVLVGPKRIEVLFRRKDNDLKEARVVITSITPPQGSFNYTSAVGRIWKTYGHELSRSIEHFYSTRYWIAEITLFAGGTAGAATTSKYSKNGGEQPWHFLEKVYYGFKQPEMAVARSWEPGKASVLQPAAHAGVAGCVDEDDVYGIGAHYLNRIPQHYQKHVGFFRVSGDKVGAEIHRQQEESREWEPQTLEQLVDFERELREKLGQKEAEEEANKEGSSEEEAEKKTEPAGATTTSRTAGNTPTNAIPAGKSAVVGRIGPARQIPACATSVDAHYCDCGSPMCENCLWTQAVENLGGGGDHLKILH